MNSTDENLLILDAAFRRSNDNETASQFQATYEGAVHFHAAEHVRVKSITVPNLFPNVYGKQAKLFVEVDGSVRIIELAPCHVNAVQLAAKLSAVEASPLTVAFNESNFERAPRFTITSTSATPVRVLTAGEVDLLDVDRRNVPSMNKILGLTRGSPPLVAGQSYTAIDPPNLMGVKTVYIKSDRLALGHAIVPTRNIDSVFTYINLDTTPYGNSASRQINDHFSDSLFFPGEVDCNTIDITLVDEYDQVLELPENHNMQLQLIIGNGTKEL